MNAIDSALRGLTMKSSRRFIIASAVFLVSHSASSAPEKSYLDERTGQQCVQQIPSIPGYPFQPTETHGYFYLKNTCPRTFSVIVTFSNGKVRSNGIGANDKTHISCVRAAGECEGHASWEIR